MEKTNQKIVEISKNNIYINEETPLEISFFEDKSKIENYKCIICKKIPKPKKAVYLLCCTKLVCKLCLTKWIYDYNKCPNCSKDLIIENKIETINENYPELYNKINSMIVICQSKCGWKGELKDYENHLETEKITLYPCKYKFIGCEYCSIKENVIKHENENNKLHFQLSLDCLHKLTEPNNKKSVLKFKENEICSVIIHPHPLKYTHSYDWRCSSIISQKKCYSDSPSFPASVGRFRWYIYIYIY